MYHSVGSLLIVAALSSYGDCFGREELHKMQDGYRRWREQNNAVMVGGRVAVNCIKTYPEAQMIHLHAIEADDRNIGDTSGLFS
jgi:hypothetical protein